MHIGQLIELQLSSVLYPTTATIALSLKLMNRSAASADDFSQPMLFLITAYIEESWEQNIFFSFFRWGVGWTLDKKNKPMILNHVPLNSNVSSVLPSKISATSEFLSALLLFLLLPPCAVKV